MSYNKSLDFLNMIKNNAPSPKEPAEPCERTSKLSHRGELFAVIDTETNWNNQVMSVGVALADAGSMECVDVRYYIIDPEYRLGGYYSNAMKSCSARPFTASRNQVIRDILRLLKDNDITRILAYNAGFDLGHLPELGGFKWYDIMRIAAYKQYNPAIPDTADCCKTGRLRTNYGVEPIMQMLTGDCCYSEVHNAAADAEDELKIVKLLGLELDAYECARING